VADRWLWCGRQVQLAVRHMQQTVAVLGPRLVVVHFVTDSVCGGTDEKSLKYML
jgi:hypothetical protein